MRKTKFASFCSHREKLALWNDPVALSPISVWAVSQNSGTDILFPLEVIDEEIRYFSDVLLFFCRECTKPYFPSPIVFNQQEARLSVQNSKMFSSLDPSWRLFLTLFLMHALQMWLWLAAAFLAGFLTHVSAWLWVLPAGHRGCTHCFPSSSPFPVAQPSPFC